jgi:hypothetical protein
LRRWEGALSAVGGALQASLFELRPDKSLEVGGKAFGRWRQKRDNFLFSSINQTRFHHDTGLSAINLPHLPNLPNEIFVALISSG